MDYLFEQLEEAPLTQEPLPSQDLRQLNSRHEMVILLHLQGLPPEVISNTTGYNQQYVNWILRQPLAKTVIKARFEEMDEEFKALYNKAIEAVREGLESASEDTKLKAADKWLKAHGKYDNVIEEKDTAEDVIKRILEIKLTETRPIKGG